MGIFSHLLVPFSSSHNHRMSWRRFYELERRFLPFSQTYHPFPSQRFAAMHPR